MRVVGFFVVLGFRVWSLDFGFSGCSGFGLEIFGAWGLGFRVWSLDFGFWGSGFGVWILGLGVQALRSSAWGLEFLV